MKNHIPQHDRPSRQSVGSTLVKSARIALVILGIIVAGIALLIWLGGDSSTLPFDYEGFD